MKKVKRICLIGAESTGKTSLARTLSSALKCPWVDEYLREFCEVNKNTPRQDEQEQIFDTQAIREDIAAANAEAAGVRFLICDTSPLLTAVYSDFIFQDKSLYSRAIEWQRRYAVTLLTAPDLAWIADGLQRDGEHVREPVTHLIHKKLTGYRLNFASITGDGHERTLAALHAIDTLL